MSLIHVRADGEAIPVPAQGDLDGRQVVRVDTLGDKSSFNAVAPVRAAGSNPSFTNYAIKNIAGFKEFVLAVPSLPSNEYLVFAWSSAEDDEAALSLLMDPFCDEIESGIATLKAGTISANVDKLSVSGETATKRWNGETTIKTICAVVVKLGSVTPTGNVFYNAWVTQ